MNGTAAVGPRAAARKNMSLLVRACDDISNFAKIRTHSEVYTQLLRDFCSFVAVTWSLPVLKQRFFSPCIFIVSLSTALFTVAGFCVVSNHFVFQIGHGKWLVVCHYLLQGVRPSKKKKAESAATILTLKMIALLRGSDAKRGEVKIDAESISSMETLTVGPVSNFWSVSDGQMRKRLSAEIESTNSVEYHRTKKRRSRKQQLQSTTSEDSLLQSTTSERGQRRRRNIT